MKKLIFTLLFVFVSLVHAQKLESYRVTQPNGLLQSLSNVYDYHFLMFDGDYGTLTVFRHDFKDAESKVSAFDYVKKQVFAEYILYEFNTKVLLERNETAKVETYIEKRTNWKIFFYNSGTTKTDLSSAKYKITYTKETWDKKEEQISEPFISNGNLNPWENLNLSIVQD